MSDRPTALNAAIWSAIGTWGRRFIGFIVFAILARHITAESLGLVALATMYIGFIEMLSKQGVSMALIQRTQLTDSLLSTAFSFNVGIAIALAASSIALAAPISDLLGDASLKPFIQALAIIPILGATSIVPISLQSRALDFRSIAVQTFAATIGAALVSVPMAIGGYQAWALVAQAIVFALVHCGTVWSQSDWRPRLSVNTAELKSLTSFSLKILLSNLVNFARIRSDQILIGISVGAVGLGLYALAQKLGETLESFIKTPIDQVALPIFSRIQNDPIKLEKTLERYSSINALISAPIYTGIALLAPEAIAIAFGPQWTEAATLCSIVTIKRMIGNLFFLNYHVFISQGYPGRQTAWQSIQAIGAIAGTLIGQRWGVEGIAYGVAISGSILSAVSTLTISRLTGIKAWPIYKSILPACAAASLMAGAVLALRHSFEFATLPPTAIIFILCASGAIVYILASYLLSPKIFSESIRLMKSRGKQTP